MTHAVKKLIEEARWYMDGNDRNLSFSERVNRKRPLYAAISAVEAEEREGKDGQAAD